ncbi:MAG: class III poly(R)-hydroxyalkanoic acid synthase subunit PhaE [Acidiferrobacterales bacterium]|jgi:class III poly(R)-hydroxyalkanoic acid synthase PhaE subunit
MSDNSHSTGINDWMDLQRKYWDAWSALGAQTPGSVAPEKAINPWADALEQWWKAAAPGTSTEVENFYTRLVEQGKTFFRLSEGLSEALRRATPDGQPLSEWQGEMEQAFTGLKEAFSGSGTDAHNMMRQLMAFWELPLDTWQRTMSSMSAVPSDFLQSLRSEELERIKPVLEGGIDRFLSIPGVGYTREWQEQLQARGRLWLDYQKANQDYLAGYAKIGTRSVGRLEQKLKQLLKDGKELTTLRELYDLWVDCCEDVYGEYIATDEYADLRARLVNSLMALKHHGSTMVDAVLGAMNMPTQREVSTLQCRLQETRRDSKALRAELQSLKDRVEGLARAQQAANSQSAQASPSPSTAKGAGTTKQPVQHTSRRKKAKAVGAASRTSGHDAVKGG